MSGAVSFVASFSLCANASVYTVNNVGLGTATSDRFTALGISSRYSGAGPAAISSVTIAGAAAAVVNDGTNDAFLDQNSGAAGNISAIYILATPTASFSASATVVVTFDTSMLRAGIGSWKLTNINSATADRVGSSTNTLTSTFTLTICTSGVAIGVGTAGSVPTEAWTNITEDYGIGIEGAMRATGASDAYGVGGTTIIECLWAGTPSGVAVVGAAWPPAAVGGGGLAIGGLMQMGIGRSPPMDLQPSLKDFIRW